MDKILIHGGKQLKGEIKISGSKNSALPILFASLLTDEPVIIKNVPSLADVDTTIGLLNFIGKKAIKKGHTVKVISKQKYKHIAPYDLVRKMRASILIMGPLLARLKKAYVSLPGGCTIGSRPIDIHLYAFKQLGAEISINEGYVKTFAKNGLKGNVIHFKFPSVGATENVLLSAVLAEGKVTIINAAREPEIEDLANVLVKMGANIAGAGTNKIIINGTKKLKGFVHSVIPDRIEAATYMIATAITKGHVTIKNVEPKHLYTISKSLKSCGITIKETQNTIFVKWTKYLKSKNIVTGVYPGFPTDVQAQWMALMCLAKGTSKITETIFENRFMHVSELQRFGANITANGNEVLVRGVKKLSGAPVMVSDLRAGAALILAGLAAEGKTVISRVYHLDRGYDALETKLKTLGANIKRTKI
ncbi:MAG: UDP-N-acetylglucosamine 1-carboxyvinyltransferase [Endomicrobium sp.]|jgi:UDP-N-acetylglucosamine 1-carboxyvinyltransferase|nr:UDP-N-acetylglucosamine 1-carboxyvinyltransferase [Endomicrobium sp.]